MGRKIVLIAPLLLLTGGIWGAGAVNPEPDTGDQRQSSDARRASSQGWEADMQPVRRPDVHRDQSSVVDLYQSEQQAQVHHPKRALNDGGFRARAARRFRAIGEHYTARQAER